MAKTRALIIVDVQPTFCEGGALAVEGGNATAERIADFVTENADEYAMVVTTQDWHVNPGSHFSEEPDFIDTWPPHALAGTAEAELHEAVASLPIDASVKKGEYEAAYSGFEGCDADGRFLEEILRAGEVEEVDVVGIAESHCVKETALDALKAASPWGTSDGKTERAASVANSASGTKRVVFISFATSIFTALGPSSAIHERTAPP